MHRCILGNSVGSSSSLLQDSTICSLDTLCSLYSLWRKNCSMQTLISFSCWIFNLLGLKKKSIIFWSKIKLIQNLLEERLCEIVTDSCIFCNIFKEICIMSCNLPELVAIFTDHSFFWTNSSSTSRFLLALHTSLIGSCLGFLTTWEIFI